MKRLVLSLISLIGTSTICAQSDTSRMLDEVTVTANRFLQKQQSTGKVVTVIPKSVIEKNSGLTLGELLNQQAGITIAGANNNLGTNQDVYLRGAATGNTLVLVDGIPAYDPSTIASTFDLNHMALDQLERIEILRGAQSTAFGSDAVAGVVNLITRQKADKPVNAYGTLAYGSFSTFRGLGGLRGQMGKTSYQFQYQRQSSGGFSAAHDSTDTAGYDKDGFSQDVVNGAVQTMLGSRLQWRANGQWGRYRTDLDAAAFTDEKDHRADNSNLQYGTGFTFFANELTLHATYNGNKSDRRYVNDSIDKAGFSVYSREHYTGRSQFAELYGTFQLSDQWRFLAGMDYRWQNTDQSFFSVSSFGPYETSLSADSARINMLGAYGSAFWNSGRGFFLEAGGRYNKHNRFGDAFTFSVNPSYLWKERWKIFLNIATAFKAPSLYQLYDASVGRTDLQAERSITYEAGLQYIHPPKAFSTRLVFFAREIREGIDFSFVDFRYFNNNRQQDHGLEWEGNIRKDKWDISANYTYVSGEVNTTKYIYDPGSFSYFPNGDTTFNNLYRRPKHSGSVSVGFQASGRLYLRGSARFQGTRYEPQFMESPLKLDPYQTVNLYAEYRFWKKQVIFVDIRNMFNEEYFDVAGFNAKPRNFMTGIRLNF